MGPDVRPAAGAASPTGATRGRPRRRRQRVRWRCLVVRRWDADVVDLCCVGPNLVLQVGEIPLDGRHTDIYHLFFALFLSLKYGLSLSLLLVVCPCCSIRDQVMFDSTSTMRRDSMVAGVDPGMTSVCQMEQQAPSVDWQQAYTSAEFFSTLIPSTPYPLDDQVMQNE